MLQPNILEKRFASVTEEKSTGATYTPIELADFVAEKIVEEFQVSPGKTIHILDPAAGEGELLLSLLSKLTVPLTTKIIVHGFDTNSRALNRTKARISQAFPIIQTRLYPSDFLEFAFSTYEDRVGLFSDSVIPKKFDLIIANPPYVRTQIMGADKSRKLSQNSGLSGKIDLYHVFLAGIAQVLDSKGRAGIIVSNRFMTTKGGGSLRELLREKFRLRHVWDLGDTKLFNAAVLPAVILAEGISDSTSKTEILFSTIYETRETSQALADSPIAALAMQGIVSLTDGRNFKVEHGLLDTTGKDSLWRIATAKSDAWLAIVKSHTWGAFRDIGKIRVGVKTCADKIFIRSDWGAPEDQPELLRPLTTHHNSRRFRPKDSKKSSAILYPHEVVQAQRRASDLDLYPKTKAYLERHREKLEDRSYVIEGGRKWYELWVPQDPEAWAAPKLVFRDISEKPTFWLDLEGTVVNGDCYWLTPLNKTDEHLLWLAAAVANSTFIEAFYDHRFNNKLYAGRRRFITQYVEQFPLPNPSSLIAQEITALAKVAYNTSSSSELEAIEAKIDTMVWQAFGLDSEETTR
ncbi:N-6 DNA methylase [Deinococcus detaillensis]|uniref:site-specific DNA-methyltransferase (adenine-specific) n=1 Tax=Deinococcus detaillensis TaxID=2592048 RepID=A0A553UH56_9DEIO|nr:N-6 DNA methylase [Deinococcus detaillensis]TSA79545.1 N-6 DNA methylase [Deinococcus detaillensis]